MTPVTPKIYKTVRKYIHKTISNFILVIFSVTSLNTIGYAQSAQSVSVSNMPWMPKPGVRVGLSPEFKPAHLLGMTIHPDNALQFDFLIHRGDTSLSDSQKKEEYNKLVKYFLASLTIPDEDQWVNLSPYEKNRIIKDNFGTTEMGRDLLAQDYILKQITSSLIYPEDALGKKFWDKVYERAYQEYGTTNVPVNTFNKVWIVPDEAVVYESGNTAYVLKSHLKVMLEEDYLSLEKHNVGAGSKPVPTKVTHTLAAKIIKDIILPELEKEVNGGQNFANLRQIFNSLILASWYKNNLKEALLNQVYTDKKKVKGIDLKDKTIKEQIYKRYLQAYKKGVFNFIKEDMNTSKGTVVPRKYFSGGVGILNTPATHPTRASYKDFAILTFAIRMKKQAFLPIF